MGKNKFKPEYSTKFNGIVAGKNEFNAKCVPCDQQISLKTTGKAAILDHEKTAKHKSNVKIKAQTKSIQAFTTTTKWNSEDEKVFAAEGVFAYHIAKHGQSFASTNCVSSEGLFRTMFPDSNLAKKYGSAETKTAAIVKSKLFFKFNIILTFLGVLAPHSIELVLKELGDGPFSISIDASNHKEIKMFPIIIR